MQVREGCGNRFLQRFNMQATGAHHFWGFTPPLDCQELHRVVNEGVDEDTTKPLTVALVDVGDIRHVLKTVAQRRRHSSRPLKVRQ